MAESPQHPQASAPSQVIQWIDEGRLDEAAKAAASALETARQAHAKDAASALPALLNALHDQATVLRVQGELAQAQSLFQEALQSADSPAMPADLRARLRTGLAVTADLLGDNAIDFYEAAIADLEALDPADNTTAAQLRNNVALAYKHAGKFSLAEKHYHRAVEVLEALHGRQSEEVGSLYNNVGGLYYAAGFVEQAREMFNDALEIRRQILDANHPDIAQTLSNLGIACHELGDQRAAQAHYEASLAILEGHLTDPNEARSYKAVGQDFVALLSAIGENAKAAAQQERIKEQLSAVS